MASSLSRLRCRDVVVLLSAYAEGETASAVSRGIRAHLDGCASCRGELARTERALGVLRKAQPAAAPPDLAAGLYARIADLDRRPAPSLRMLRYAGAAACALLVVVAGARVMTFVTRSAEMPPLPPVAPRIELRIPQVDAAPRVASSRRASVAPVVGAPAGAGLRSAEAVVGVAQDVPSAAVRTRARRTYRPSVPSPSGFLDVADSRGITARMLRSAAQGAERVASVEAALDERVRVGSSVTVVQGDRVLDDAGRLAVIRVRAETADGEPERPEPDER